MAEKKPLVLNGGEIEQLQSGDTLPGGGTSSTFAEIFRFGIIDPQDPMGGMMVTLTKSDVSGNMINNFGQEVEITFYILPPAEAGLTFMFIFGLPATASIGFIADEDDAIYLSGKPLIEESVIIRGTVISGPDLETGSCLSFSTFKTGETQWDWAITPVAGEWYLANPKTMGG